MKLLIATGNKGKLREIRHALEGSTFEVIGLADLDESMDVEESGVTFVANAKLKAAAFGRKFGYLTLADDSGLCVDALDGAPGVWSARYSGPDANAESNNAKLLIELAKHPRPWGAHFHCAMALWVPHDVPLPGVQDGIDFESGSDTFALASGESFGEIVENAAGNDGFGYDPIFLSTDLGVTFAEASKEEKLQVSHRGRALTPIIALLRSLGAK